MGKIRSRVLVFVLLMTILLTSCGGRRVKVDYREYAFSCRLSFERSGETVEALLEVGKPISGKKREMKMRITEPRGLSEIEFYFDGETFGVGSSETELPFAVFSRVLSVGERLLPNGTLKVSGRVRYGEGEALYAITEEEDWGVYLDKETYIPLEISSDEGRIIIKDFEFEEG